MTAARDPAFQLASSRLDARDPGGDLTVDKPSRVQLLVTHCHDGDPHEVAQLEVRIGRDIHAGDRERPVQPDPAERAVGLLAQMTADALVERDPERRRAMRAEPHQCEAAAEVPA